MKSTAPEATSASRFTGASRAIDPSRATGGVAEAEHEHARAALVVGLDGREHDADALALARSLRGAFDGEIRLVHVLAEAPLGRGMAEFQTLQWREGQALLGRAAATIGEGAEVELINPWPAALALERVAFKSHASLLVLGSSHHRAPGRIVPGSVALHLIKGSPCPVAVAPVGYAHERAAAISRLGVAYDATPGADAALLVAASVAARLGIPLHVYHAVARDQDLSQLGSSAGAILERALQQLPASVQPVARAVAGDPAGAIVAASREDDVGLLFAGSRGHGPLREGLFGGVCRGLLESAACPVVLTPHGLESARWRGAASPPGG